MNRSNVMNIWQMLPDFDIKNKKKRKMIEVVKNGTGTWNRYEDYSCR